MSRREFRAGPGDDGRAVPVRLLVVQEEERPPVDSEDEPVVMTVPHLVLREAVAFLSLSVVLCALALLVDAPLAHLANPEQTPNPAKAAWYFLGLQELLHYFPPIVAGVLIPALLLLALVVIPYVPTNLVPDPLELRHRPQAAAGLLLAIAALSAVFAFAGAHPPWPLLGPLWLVGAAALATGISRGAGPRAGWLKRQGLSFWVFTWFLLTTVTLTVVGVFFRGPGWRWSLPWRDGIFL